uniref:Condensation domain-containing protein n=1 Tax=Haptolina brevifila TaxID=156173 RepID=A0A7S2CFM9_9EUKA
MMASPTELSNNVTRAASPIDFNDANDSLASAVRLIKSNDSLASADVELNYMEQAVAKVYPCIASVNFYTGDADKVAAFLQERTAAIVTASPWLAGSIHSIDGKLNLRIPAKVDPEPNFTDITMLELMPTMDNDRMHKLLEPVLVKSGVGAGGPLYRVVLVRTQPAKFAVVVSLHHGCADGSTFYQLHGMLDKRASVATLASERDEAFSQAGVQQLLGERRVAWQTGLSVISKTVATMAIPFLTSDVSTYTYMVDEAWVAQQKALHKQGGATEAAPYVSTNDILTSSLANAIGANWCLMNVDLRNHMVGLTKQLGGNYFGRMLHSREEFATPGKIRERLQQLGSQGTDGTTPSPLETWLSLDLVQVTNWSSLAVGKTLELQSCEQILHVPLMKPPKLPGGYNVIVIFQATASRLGVRLLTTRPEFADALSRVEGLTPFQVPT